MSVSGRLRRALPAPPYVTVGRAARKVRHAFDAWSERRRDRNRPTYALAGAPSGALAAFLGPLDVAPDAVDLDATEACARHALEHRFDLLGSGWTVVRHGMTCRGVEGSRYDAGQPVSVDPDGRWLAGRINAANRPETQRLWRLIETPYTPIDWQLDFKSGYRWSERAWHGDVPYAHRPGVDVKVPWELARLQHLPQAAAAAAVLRSAGRGQAVSPETCARAFRNQVLDFMATNPPRYGVNWRCTMDVAIRVANMVLARDLLLAQGERFDEPFEAALARSVYEHGRFIVGHLEWGPALRSNHYLSNVVGLLFAAAYLPAGRETNAWLAFALQELLNEVEIQFGADGANFEASTSYHRLSAEMVVFATALVLGLPEDRLAALRNSDAAALDTPVPLDVARLSAPGAASFPPSYVSRLAGMRRFTRAIGAGQGRCTAQIGDNDSGRFFRLQPSCERLTVANAKERFANLRGYAELADGADYWRERGCDHRHLLAALDTLLGTPAPGIDAAVVHALAGGRTLAPPDDTPQGTAFPDFGAWVYRSEHLHIVARAGNVGQLGNGGHAHNDQLSFVLFVDDVPVIVDPGTFLYTPAPAMRNLFRSTSMHNTVVVRGSEQNEWAPGADGLFCLRTARRATVRRADNAVWEAEFDAYGTPHRRVIRIGADRLDVEDTCPHASAQSLMVHLHPDVEIADVSPTTARLRAAGRTITIGVADDVDPAAGWEVGAAPYSDGYGWCAAGRALEFPLANAGIRWFVTIGGD